MIKPLYGPKCGSRKLEPTKADAPFRSVFRRDYARLIHAPSFRRLQGKTQLYPGHESDFFRNRLTHSMEVAQIAKGIAQLLNHETEFLHGNEIDCDLVEFAALAHDLGHPPFGHNGEKALDDCMKNYGGFEGNAQTLRILSVVEKKETSTGDLEGITPDGEDRRIGLNLTFRSLASILKYDKRIPESRKKEAGLVKGYYSSEKALVSQIKKNIAPSLKRGRKFKTVECQIMDFADDIAYSTYDLEDGLKGGFVDPLMLMDIVSRDAQLLSRVAEKVQDEIPSATPEDVAKAIAEALGFDMTGCPRIRGDGPTMPQPTPLEAYRMSKLIAGNGYTRSNLTSGLVDRFIRSLSITIDEEIPAFSTVSMADDARLQVESLKHLNYEVTIMSPRLKLVEYRGYEIVKTLFEALTEEKKGFLLLPQDVKENFVRVKDGEAGKRLVCDFVAGMTDRYAVEFFGRLKQGDQSMFKPF